MPSNRTMVSDFDAAGDIASWDPIGSPIASAWCAFIRAALNSQWLARSPAMWHARLLDESHQATGNDRRQTARSERCTAAANIARNSLSDNIGFSRRSGQDFPD